MSVDNAKIFSFQFLKVLDYTTGKLLWDGYQSGSVTFNFSAEFAEQSAGPSLFPIETEILKFTGEATIMLQDYSSQALAFVLGASIVDHDISAGLVTDINNLTGDVFENAKGITAIKVNADTATIKSGIYQLKVEHLVDKKVRLYAIAAPDLISSDYADEATGYVKEVILPDNQADTDLGIGVDLTTASVDLSDFSVGDTIEFRVFAKGDSAYTASIGQKSLKIPAVKIVCFSRSMADGRWSSITCEKALFGGMSIGFTDEISSSDLAGRIIYDDRTKRVATFTPYAKVGAGA